MFRLCVRTSERGMGHRLTDKRTGEENVKLVCPNPPTYSTIMYFNSIENYQSTRFVRQCISGTTDFRPW